MRYAKFLNSIEEVSEAVELVDDALKHEPIFNDSLSKSELGDFNSKQDLQALEEEEEEDTRSVHVFTWTILTVKFTDYRLPDLTGPF